MGLHSLLLLPTRGDDMPNQGVREVRNRATQEEGETLEKATPQTPWLLGDSPHDIQDAAVAILLLTANRHDEPAANCVDRMDKRRCDAHD